MRAAFYRPAYWRCASAWPLPKWLLTDKNDWFRRAYLKSVFVYLIIVEWEAINPRSVITINTFPKDLNSTKLLHLSAAEPRDLFWLFLSKNVAHALKVHKRARACVCDRDLLSLRRAGGFNKWDRLICILWAAWRKQQLPSTQCAYFSFALNQGNARHRKRVYMLWNWCSAECVWTRACRYLVWCLYYWELRPDIWWVEKCTCAFCSDANAWRKHVAICNFFSYVIAVICVGDREIAWNHFFFFLTSLKFIGKYLSYLHLSFYGTFLRNFCCWIIPKPRFLRYKYLIWSTLDLWKKMACVNSRKSWFLLIICKRKEKFINCVEQLNLFLRC